MFSSSRVQLREAFATFPLHRLDQPCSLPGTVGGEGSRAYWESVDNKLYPEDTDNCFPTLLVRQDCVD